MSLNDVFKPKNKDIIKNDIINIYGVTPEFSQLLLNLLDDFPLRSFRSIKVDDAQKLDISIDLNDYIFLIVFEKISCNYLVLPPKSVFFSKRFYVDSYNELKKEILKWIHGKYKEHEERLNQLSKKQYPDLYNQENY